MIDIVVLDMIDKSMVSLTFRQIWKVYSKINETVPYRMNNDNEIGLIMIDFI
jgi:hypothetical protein